jgi:hypothetical protein
VKIPDEVKEQIFKKVDEILTLDAVERLVTERMTSVVNDCLSFALASLEQLVVDQVTAGIDFKGIGEKAKQVLAEQIDERVRDQVRDISRYDLRDSLEKEANRVVPDVVKKMAHNMDIASMITEALKRAVETEISRPVSEIVKQHLGLVYSEFLSMKETTNQIQQSYQYLQNDVEQLKRRQP